MIWLWVVVLVVVIGVVAVLAAGRDSSMAEVYEDRPDRSIPTGRTLTSDDLQAVRFTTAVRGYRMDEVDALLDRVRADLIAREYDEHDEHDEHDEDNAAGTPLPSRTAAAPQPQPPGQPQPPAETGQPQPPREPGEPGQLAQQARGPADPDASDDDGPRHSRRQPPEPA